MSLSDPLSAALLRSPRLYNSFSRQVEPWVPPGRQVGVYVCGVTPYDTTHLGHAFSYVVYDALVRYLRSLGYAVRYVQNITDVDDDLLGRARELGVPFQDLTARYLAVFEADMAALNVQRPDMVARATDHIPVMQQMIATLLERGRAYLREGRVYFRVRSAPDYGRLSGCSREEMLVLSRERGGDPTDPRKEDPLDFLMWQPSRPDEPAWDSLWGPGRPGWHIECSAIALTYLGATVDLHGGGYDLIFPHHESERVQSEGYTSQPFVRHWVHNGMLHIGGRKMSKSLKNMVMVRALLDRYPAAALRWYLLSHHYRPAFEYREEDLGEAARQLAVCQEAAGLREVASLGPGPEAVDFRDLFLDALADDFDTPGALRVLLDLAHGLLRAHDLGLDILPGRTALVELADVLGISLAPAP
ncbi:MAG: cysteine--tRNA ligase [Chloroflexi bacterium]|nr:cysteine--tRNA ligase [Chloroflexota bacterium]